MCHDVRDLEGDAADGTLSIPVLLGARGAMRLVAAAAALDAAVCWSVFGSPALLVGPALLGVHALTLQGGCRWVHEAAEQVPMVQLAALLALSAAGAATSALTPCTIPRLLALPIWL